jgi:ABC-2 type transport system permease protein
MDFSGLRVYGKAYKAVLMTKLEYRLDFAIGAFSAGALQLSGLLFLNVALQGLPALGGWTLPEIVFLFGLTGAALGMSELFFNHLWYLPYYVVNGELDRLLLYPVRSLPFFLVTSPELHAFGNLGTGLALMGWAWWKLQLAWWAVPMALWWLACGTLIYTGVLVVLFSMCFVFVGPKFSLPFMANHLLLASRYPLGIYPWAVKWGLIVIIPYGAFGFLPAHWLFHGGSLAWSLVLPGAVAAAVSVAAKFAWEAGLRRYESTGS